MISESGSVEAMLRSPGFPAFSAATLDHQKVRNVNFLNTMTGKITFKFCSTFRRFLFLSYQYSVMVIMTDSGNQN